MTHSFDDMIMNGEKSSFSRMKFDLGRQERISTTGWNERRVIDSFSFYDDSLSMIVCRAQVLRSSVQWLQN